MTVKTFHVVMSTVWKLFLHRLAPITWSTYLGLSMRMKVNHVTWTYYKIYSIFYTLFLMFN